MPPSFCLAIHTEGVVVQCKIIRDKRGMDRGMFPTYILKLERPEEEGVHQVFLLAGRKRKKSKSSNYIISLDQADLSRESESFIAKLRFENKKMEERER